MQSRFSKLVIMVFLLSVLPSNFQVANSNEILWGPNFGNDAYRPSNLVPGAEIRSVRPLVYKSNPDEMIFKITMVDSFEDKPFTNKGRYLALNIFVGNGNCVNTNITTDDERCKSVQSVIAPDSPRLYPTSKSDEWVPVYDREVTFGPKRVATSCKAPWWIESNFKSRDTWAFAISITCLKLPKEFGFYGVSDINLGQKEVAYTTSSTVTIEYPFHELAKAAADRASQNTSQVEKMTEVCETFMRRANSSDWEPYIECDTKNSTDLGFCSLHPRADLQTYKNGKWIKIKTMRGKKTDCDYNRYLFEHIINFKTPFEQEYRWKEYGNSKLKTSYYYLKISQKLKLIAE